MATAIVAKARVKADSARAAKVVLAASVQASDDLTENDQLPPAATFRNSRATDAPPPAHAPTVRNSIAQSVRVSTVASVQNLPAADVHPAAREVNAHDPEVQIVHVPTVPTNSSSPSPAAKNFAVKEAAAIAPTSLVEIAQNLGAATVQSSVVVPVHRAADEASAQVSAVQSVRSSVQAVVAVRSAEVPARHVENSALALSAAMIGRARGIDDQVRPVHT